MATERISLVSRPFLSGLIHIQESNGHKTHLNLNQNLRALCKQGRLKEALNILFTAQNPAVDSSTYLQLLQTCMAKNALSEGKQLHSHINGREFTFTTDTFLRNTIINMYDKCGSLVDAREVFDHMTERDIFSWNMAITAYQRHGLPQEALTLFRQMQRADVQSDKFTFATILPACATMGVLKQGMYIHQSIMERNLLSNVEVVNALVDMYAKCGSIHKACELFEKMPQRDVVSWTAMISGYAQNGLSEDALELFELMKYSGTYPNHVSFTCVLLACSHAGLVDEGCKYFNGMSSSYCIVPTIDHYVCMVDLLGRAGYLEETLNLIIKMPLKPVVVVWTCLLGACRAHKNIELGVFTATLLFELDPQNAATYAVLSNIYAEVGRWREAQMIRKLMKDKRN